MIIEYGPTADDSADYSATCSAGLSLYNAGHSDLALYVYKRSFAGRPPCPLPGPYAITVTLAKSGNGIVAIYTVPLALRHFPARSDDAVTTEILNIAVATRKLGKTKVGFLESTSCPVNHQRQTAITFTEENGSSHTATRNFFCQ
jgi:hypothetical protein